MQDTSTETAEADEWLRTTYGPDAVFSQSGNITLVHLDSPDPATVRRRTREFDPRAYWVDDCELCRRQRERGGHFVFDARPLEDPDADDPRIGPLPPGPAPSVLAAASAIDRTATAAETLIAALETIGSPALLARAAADLGSLTNRILDAAWSDAAGERADGPRLAISAALETTEAIRREHPECAVAAGELEASLDELARLLETGQ
jgi:hypothetical protein